MTLQISSPFSKGLLADVLLGVVAILVGSFFASDDIFGAHTLKSIFTRTFVFTFFLFITLIIMRTGRTVWRWTTLDDIMLVVQAIAIATVCYVLFAAFIFPKIGILINSSEPFLCMFFLTSFLLGGRGIVRVMSSGGNIRSLTGLLKSVEKNAPAAILIGATDSITASLHELRKLGPLPFNPIAIVSTFGNHINKSYSGAKVFDGTKPEKIIEELAIDVLKKENDVRLVLVGNSQPQGVAQAAMNVVKKTGAKIARMPEIGSKQLTSVKPEDVLGRRHVNLDVTAPTHLIRHKTVLITGGGGTIGGELSKQIAKLSPGRLILVDNSENNLFLAATELRETHPDLLVIEKLCDIREADQIKDIFEKYRPQIVFHAAANKHVPMMETHPRQALLVNLGGTKAIADAAIAVDTETFILISTDKAVNPSNMMGAAKRSAEIYVRHCYEKFNGRFYSVRFGNVLGSSGSVMPLFERQISRGGPLTITHRDMTRWFMTVQEAVGLVLQCAALSGGQIKTQDNEIAKISDSLLVLDMGDPVRIMEFAETMIRLRGFEPQKDIKIIETGPRPGEKLHEELFYASEQVSSSPVDGILCARPTIPLPKNITAQIDKILELANTNKIDKAIESLKILVPEFIHHSDY